MYKREQLSARDAMATAALAAMISREDQLDLKYSDDGYISTKIDDLARMSYRIADAMMEARKIRDDYSEDSPSPGSSS